LNLQQPNDSFYAGVINSLSKIYELHDDDQVWLKCVGESQIKCNCKISGVCLVIVDVFAPLGMLHRYVVSRLPMFQDSLAVPSSRIGLMGFPVMSVAIYQNAT